MDWLESLREEVYTLENSRQEGVRLQEKYLLGLLHLALLLLVILGLAILTDRYLMRTPLPLH